MYASVDLSIYLSYLFSAQSILEYITSDNIITYSQ